MCLVVLVDGKGLESASCTAFILAPALTPAPVLLGGGRAGDAGGRF